MANRHPRARPYHDPSSGLISGHLNGVPPAGGRSDPCNGRKPPVGRPASGAVVWVPVGYLFSAERQTAEAYRRFAEVEAHGVSAIYYEWANAIADDPEVLALIAKLPGMKKQANLVFAASRSLGAPVGLSRVRMFGRGS
jgi:hypothetical protein